ncbi:hypothetical protein MPH_12955 [Macrophomina phaseolina MS6]|uniref:Uncharacterized protein n=1 Tax=Macrophomina phaseolina (strain MS6) TaxID=1126212 RepID=K2R6W6_MACPH|nr:hypothetical protein MPH_12955 [Macrophomina phaseolina MS6]
MKKDLPTDMCIEIIEESLHEQQYSDGDIFRKIRTYHKQGDEKSERKWWARLSNTKQKDLKQLFKIPELTDAFDNLVGMPGMWQSFQLGTLHRLLTLHCDEELLRYLTRIADVLGGVLRAANIPPEAVDNVTIAKLELLAPSVSDGDRMRVEGLIRSGEVFPSITNAQKRDAILSALLLTPGLIPTLTSFFENLKYLEPCCYILKKLLPGKEKRTIFQSLAASYIAPKEQLLEYSTGSRLRSIVGDENALWLAYVQLWAFCMRHFPSMTETAPRKVVGKAKPSKSSNSALWHYLGDLAIKLGFRTPQALELQRQNPYESLAQQLLRSLRPASPPDMRHVLRVAAACKEIEDDPKVREWPNLTATDHLPREKRCGRPFEDDFLLDSNFLFVPTIYEIEETKGPEISSLFVKRDLFISFLGNKYTLQPTQNAEADEYSSSATRSFALESPPGTSIQGSARDEYRFQELSEALDEERRQTDQLRRLKQMEDSISSLTGEIEERGHTSRMLEIQISELTARCDDFRSRETTLNAHIQEREELFQVKHDRLRSMNIELEKGMAEKEDQLQARSTAYEEEKVELKRQLETCQILNDQLNEELDRGKILQREGHDKTRKLQEHIECLQNFLVEAEQTRDAKVRQLREQQSEIEQLRAKIRNGRIADEQRREKESKLEQNHDELQRRWQESARRETYLELAVKELKSTTELLREERSRLSSECSKLQADFEDSKKQSLELIDDRVRLEGTLNNTIKNKDDHIRVLEEQVKNLERQAELHQRQGTPELTELLSMSVEGESTVVGIFVITVRTGEFWIQIPAQSPATKIERVLRVIASLEHTKPEPWEILCNRKALSEADRCDVEHIVSAIRKQRFIYAGPRSMMQIDSTTPDWQRRHSQHSQHSQHQVFKPRKRKELAQGPESEVHGDGKQSASTRTARNPEGDNQIEDVQASLYRVRTELITTRPGEGSELAWRDTFSEHGGRRKKLHHMVLYDSEMRDQPT